MNPEQQTESQTEPAAEKPSATGQTDNRRRQGRGRPRFRRDGRGRGGDRERGPRQDQPPPRAAEAATSGEGHAPGSRRLSASISRALEVVNKIRGDLQKSLEDMHQVGHALDQIEREKDATEEEIEMLRESLYNLQRNTGYRQLQSGPAPKAASPPPAPVAAAAEPEPESEPAAEEEPGEPAGE